jgi:hypothetical protein
VKIPQQDKKMKFTNRILSVSTLALAATALQTFAASPVSAAPNEPAYNPATIVSVTGTVTSVRQVAAGNPLAGVHLTLKSNSGALDVYVGPAEFLKFLKASFPVGDQIQVIGSKVKFENADVILTRQVDDGYELVTLRESNGAAEWQNWGKEIDPAQVR